MQPFDASEPLDASELPLALVLACVREIVRSGFGVLSFPTWSVKIDVSPGGRTFTWRGLTGLQLGTLDVWAEAHRHSPVIGGLLAASEGALAGILADGVDSALHALDSYRDIPWRAGYREVLVAYAETGPQEGVRTALRALLAALDVSVEQLIATGRRHAAMMTPLDRFEQQSVTDVGNQTGLHWLGTQRERLLDLAEQVHALRAQCAQLRSQKAKLLAAQPHWSHNEALQQRDALITMNVAAKTELDSGPKEMRK